MPEIYPSEISLVELRRALTHEGWTSYLYVGRASDRAWKEAKFLEHLMAGYRCYLIPDGKKAAIEELGLPANAKGLVVGSGGQPVVSLSAAKTKTARDIWRAVLSVQSGEVAP